MKAYRVNSFDTITTSRIELENKQATFTKNIDNKSINRRRKDQEKNYRHF